MAKRIVKCKICGKEFDLNSEQGVIASARRYAHYDCFPSGEIVPLPEPKVENNDKKILMNYIKELYGVKANWPLINKQIKDYVTNYQYTYSGILSTLKYFYEIQKNSPNDSNGGIGIVPFTYQNAYNYYYNLYLTSQINADKDINNFQLKEKIVSISTPRSEHSFIKLWDMDWEEE